jgi:hypothetical protein
VSPWSDSRLAFVSLVSGRRQYESFRLLLESLRTFGGPIGRSPVWLFDTAQDAVVPQQLDDEGVRTLPLIVPERIEHYEFAAKVYACVRAEEHARQAGVWSLIWVDPACLVVRPPALFELGRGFDAAVRPVHIKNVGLGVSEPVDRYWQQVYETAGVRDIKATVESFVDAQRLRAYFNTHAFAVDPRKGLMNEWYESFVKLVGDEDFQAGPCADEQHRVFLHQAILSALVASALDPARVRILPPEYNYPYHLHLDVPAERRARALNDLVCVAYEDEPPHPGAGPGGAASALGIEIREPLRGWLAERLGGPGEPRKIGEPREPGEPDTEIEPG